MGRGASKRQPQLAVAPSAMALSLVCLGAVLAGCDSGHSLFVDLRTDWVPAAEFDTVRVAVDGFRSEERVADGDADYLAGVRLSERLDISPGTRTIDVELFSGDLRIARRTVRVSLQQDSVVTIVIGRLCADVDCPDDSCLSGRCVPAECTPETPEHCPEPACVGDGDCPAPSASCAEATCSAGECFQPGLAGACSAGEYCSAETGCLPRPGQPLDAGPSVAPLSVEPPALTMNVNGQQTLVASGGVPPYRFGVVSGEGTVGADSGVVAAPNHGGTTVVRVTDGADSTVDVTVTAGGTDLFAVGGWGGFTSTHVYQSTDASGWTTHDMPTGRGETVTVVFDETMFIVGGWFSGSNIDSVLASQTGATGTWELAGTLPEPRGWGGAVVFEGRILYAGGRSPTLWANTDVYASSDGAAWTKIGDLPEASTWGGLATFHGRLFYLGGDHDGTNSDAIWTSDDGATWNVETATLPAPRAGGAIVVFDDRLWYIGGEDGGGSPADQVWVSTDGLAWTDAGGVLPAALGNPAATVHDDRIWIIGGRGADYVNSVYHSADGLAWTRATDLPESLDRFSAVSFTPP